MPKIGFLIRFDAKPGKEEDIEQALKRTVAAIEAEPGTMAWFAVRLGPSTFGVFDVFPDEESRQIHLAAGMERMKAIAPYIVESSVTIQRHDVIAAKLRN